MKGILQRENYQGDRVLWMVTALLLMASAIAVYSAIATLAYKADGNSGKFLFKHLLMIGLGFVAMFYVHKINFRYFSKLSMYLFYSSIGLLGLTLLFGVNINNASRWLKIPFLDVTFQTSDFAKVALVLYVARLLNQNRTILHNFKEGVWPILWPVMLICALILPANFSTAALLFGVCFLMMFIGGVPVKHLTRIVVVMLLAVVSILSIGKFFPEVLPRAGTWVARLENFINPDAAGNYQVQFAEVAIHEGGLLPKGPGTSVSRNVMPHPYSDMIFAFIIEEYGSILGGIGLLLLYLILGFRAVRNGVRCPKHFGGLVSIGLGFLLLIQALTNMAVSVNLFPTTGQPLPLVSMGGTTTVFNLIIVGILISISRILTNPEAFQQDREGEVQAEAQNSPANEIA